MINYINSNNLEIDQELKKLVQQFNDSANQDGWKYSEQINVLQQEKFNRSNSEVIANLSKLEKSIQALNQSISGLHDDINKSNKGAWYLSITSLIISAVVLGFTFLNSLGDKQWQKIVLTKMDETNTTIVSLPNQKQ